MNIQAKTKVKNLLEKHLGRPAKSDEIINAENDSLLLARMLDERVDDLEKKVANLEKFLVV